MSATLDHLFLNAFTGANDPVDSPIDPDVARSWGLRARPGDPPAQTDSLAPKAEVDLNDWHDPGVGWGVVLADVAEGVLSDAERAAGADAPEPIRALLAARGGAPVFRYRPDIGAHHLRRYFADHPPHDCQIADDAFGVGPDAMPYYLLIVGGPEDVPWSVQFALGRVRAVGRLPLTGEALSRYVAALLNDWAGESVASTRAIVWATDVSAADITHLMRSLIAQPVVDGLRSDAEIAAGVTELPGNAATADDLIARLAADAPGLVITSSHGMTSPLDDPAKMRAQLGVPVDQFGAALDPAAVVGAWSPAGAIWYAQACCSAGGAPKSAYLGLVNAGSTAHRVLSAVEGLGATVAPLPVALLGAAKPLRAFIGHVEPTFDWTLHDVETGQPLTHGVVSAIYPGLFLRERIGHALRPYWDGASRLWGSVEDARQAFVADPTSDRDAERAIRYKLMALDRSGLVLLGDPTVRMPPLPSQADAPVPAAVA